MELIIKIRIITQGPWCLSYGGAEVQAKKYVEYGKKIGLDIDFLNFYDKFLDYDIIHFVGLGYSTYGHASFVKKANKKVVISPVYYTSRKKEFILASTLRLTQSTHIFSLNFFGKALQIADAILPNSQAEKNQIERIFNLGKSVNKFKIIFNGVDRQNIISNSIIFRQVYGIVEPYLLCVGMIDQRKNTKNLLEGFICSRTNVKLILIGDFRDAEVDYNLGVKKLINIHSERIIHIPFISDRSLLNSAYKGALAHILPSFIETPGLSNLESQDMGTSIIVGDCPPVREYFGSSAVYVNPSDTKTISKAIDNAAQFENSLPKVKLPEKYYWDLIIKDLALVYENILR